MYEVKIITRDFGVDSVEVEHMKKIVKKGDKFAKRVLTPKEFAQYQQLKEKQRVEYLDGHFSLRESFSKALGTGLGKCVGFQDIEALWDDSGYPVTTSTKLSGSIFASTTHDDYEIITGIVLEELN